MSLPSSVAGGFPLTAKHCMSVAVSRPSQDLFADTSTIQGFDDDCVLLLVLLFLQPIAVKENASCDCPRLLAVRYYSTLDAADQSVAMEQAYSAAVV